MASFTKIWSIVYENRDNILKHSIALILIFILSAIQSAVLPEKGAIYTYFYGAPIKNKEFGEPNGILTEDLLKRYDGITEKKLYLAVLGSVFDVSKGAKYYSKGGPYHYFVGKDGSRSLITGDFKDESDNKDNVIDLSCTDINNVLTWISTYQEKYTHVGVLVGRYYDKNGKESVYYKELYHRLDQCEEDKKANKEHEKEYPPCNIAWSADKGSEVWCTINSGGISRNWAGVPRQMYTPGQDKPHCVCMNLARTDTTYQNQFKPYENCPDTSTSCIVNIS